KSQHEMSDDIALDFRRARFDCVPARAQIGVGPLAVIDGICRLAGQLAVRPKHFHRDLLHSLVHLAPEYLLNRPFWSWNARFGDSRDAAHLVQAKDFNFGVDLGELLPDDRIVACRLAVSSR